MSKQWNSSGSDGRDGRTREFLGRKQMPGRVVPRWHGFRVRVRVSPRASLELEHVLECSAVSTVSTTTQAIPAQSCTSRPSASASRRMTTRVGLRSLGSYSASGDEALPQSSD